MCVMVITRATERAVCFSIDGGEPGRLDGSDLSHRDAVCRFHLAFLVFPFHSPAGTYLRCESRPLFHSLRLSEACLPLRQAS